MCVPSDKETQIESKKFQPPNYFRDSTFQLRLLPQYWDWICSSQNWWKRKRPSPRHG